MRTATGSENLLLGSENSWLGSDNVIGAQVPRLLRGPYRCRPMRLAKGDTESLTERERERERD